MVAPKIGKISMDIAKPLALLGGLSPETFMKKHWQKKPLLIRQAVPALNAGAGGPLLERAKLFELASDESVESRLVVQSAKSKAWRLQTGPFARRALPSLKTPNWSLLVQGLDLHTDSFRALMDQFRFIPDARLDDVMVSYATQGGGVGPHFDSYDVFLLQAQGRRQWQISAQPDLTLQPNAPLKILQNFKPEQTFVLEPGDMLYLPPRYAHDGVALDECMTYSIGFQAPQAADLARELLLRFADTAEDEFAPDEDAKPRSGTKRQNRYQDPKQPAASAPAQIPPQLIEFAQTALRQALGDPNALKRALGEILSEPKAQVWFDEGTTSGRVGKVQACGVRLDRRSKMLFDDQHVFINGESFRAGGADATLMRRLANDRALSAAAVLRASIDAKSLLANWTEVGWLHDC